MFLRWRGKAKFLTLVSLAIVLCIGGGCAKPVKQAEITPLPEVEVLEQKQPKKTEEMPQPEPVPPPEVKTEDLEATVEKKTYPGIEGDFFETRELKDCHFDYDKFDLTPETRAILTEDAEILKKLKAKKVQVEGHCDERGTNEYNMALGERRASNVKSYMVSLGIPEEDISTISYGEERPLDPGHTEEAWGKNRRAHIIILSKE